MKICCGPTQLNIEFCNEKYNKNKAHEELIRHRTLEDNSTYAQKEHFESTSEKAL